MTKYIRSFLFLLLIHPGISLHAQTEEIQVSFEDKNITDAIYNIFESYPIDRVRLIFRAKSLQSVRLYELRDSTGPYHHRWRETVTYKQNFKGDQYALKKEFPSIFSLIENKHSIDAIQENIKEETFLLFLSKEGSTYRKIKLGNGGGYPNASFRENRRKELIDTLHARYDNSIVTSGDSVLIFQAVVNNNGTLLGDIALLYGEKDALHDYFLQTLAYYTKDVLAKKLHIPALFWPHNQNGGRRSLVDIYVRLNPDRTFTVSATGENRTLKIENYKDDRNNPIFY